MRIYGDVGGYPGACEGRESEDERYYDITRRFYDTITMIVALTITGYVAHTLTYVPELVCFQCPSIMKNGQ